MADRPLKVLLDEVASATPAPGGGCAAAWACALGAGLVEMTATFTLGHAEQSDQHERMAQIAARAHALRERATELAQLELNAYAPVLAALKLPADQPDRPAQIDAALDRAAQTPLALARAAGEVVSLALEASRTGTRHLQGDALTGLLLAESACQAAARLVQINLAGRAADQRLTELSELIRRAAAERAEVLRL